MKAPRQSPKWYVAYTYSRSEKKVCTNFQHLRVETYLPLQRVKQQWSDRLKWVEIPLFANYVFVRTTADYLPQLSQVSGVARFLYFENSYATVRDSEIELIRKVIEEVEDFRVQPLRLVKGDRVKIIQGPLAGIEGRMVEEQNTKRVLIAIKGIEQSLSVSIPLAALEALRPLRMTD